jgi:RNA polymerase sigma-70 factor, ECF subfamily
MALPKSQEFCSFSRKCVHSNIQSAPRHVKTAQQDYAFGHWGWRRRRRCFPSAGALHLPGCLDVLWRRIMNSTSVSLLRRLHSEEREIAWERFVELYAPLIYSWTLRSGLSGSDAADCVQDVLALLVEKLPAFTYDPNKSFRAWLRTVTVNKCRDILRRNAGVSHRTAPLAPEHAFSPDHVELFTDEEYQRSLVHRALEVMQTEFEPNTWKACWEFVTSGDSVSQVAQRLGMTENAVYLAKSRVLRRLREELDELLD